MMWEFDESCHVLDFDYLTENKDNIPLFDFGSSSDGNLLQFRGFDSFSTATNKPTKASSDEFIVSSISSMSNSLGLLASVENQANEIFKKVKNTSRRKQWNAIFAACIYVACRLESDMTRSIREISSVADGAKISDITRAVRVIAKTLKIDKTWLMNFKAIDFIKLFCSALEMDSEEVKAAQEAAQSSECVNSRRSPVSVAAAVVYAIARLSDEKTTFKGITEVTRVSRPVIVRAYEDLYPHLSKIIPKWFAEAKGLKRST